MKLRMIVFFVILMFAAMSLHVVAAEGINNRLISVSYPGESDLPEGVVRMSGVIGALPGNLEFSITNVETGAIVNGISSEDGSFVIELAAEPGHLLDLQLEGRFLEISHSGFVDSYSFMVKGGSRSVRQLKMDLGKSWSIDENKINPAASGNWFSSSFLAGYVMG